MLRNTERVLEGLTLLGADKSRYLGDDYLFKATNPNRRDIVASGMAREGSGLDRNYVYTMLFFFTPPDVVRQYLANAAAAGPIPDRPDYVWVGYMERELSPKLFPGKGERWTQVYKNPTVALYRREPAAR
jgi:hypothetical protein